MRRLSTLKRVVVLGLVSTLATPAVALPPPPSAPFTLWNFLGIPQGLNKIRDASSNRRGNFPGMERKPPLKALADPKNLESKTPAIQKAAEIKTAEDEAPQKIKAIKYLATVGCGCYEGVKEALIDSLEDCTEEVRYETVLAIQDAATLHCETCNKACCCDEELTKKLAEIAYERDDKGCWLEPSERVREAAKKAMCACCPGQGPIGEEVQTPGPDPNPEPIPTPEEPTPMPEGVEDPSASRPAARQPELITAQRVSQALTNARLPSTGAASTAVETEEVVTIDFGNGAASERVSSTRRSASPGAAIAQPAPAKTPASANTMRPASKRTVTPTAKGPSSRRSAAARGLTETKPDQTAAVEPQPVRPSLQRTPVVQTTGSLARLPDATVAYATDLPRRAGNLLAPKAVPTPPATQVVVNDAPSSKNGGRDVRGTVARVSKDAGTVEFRLDRAGDLLKAGDRLQVKHAYLFGDGEALGLVEVVSIGERGVIAKPVGKLTVERVSRGDEVRLYVPPRTAQGSKPLAEQAAVPTAPRSVAVR